jgi:hypothetical protein
MAGHARLSASAAGRWMKCPGSVAFIDAIRTGPEISSPAAMEGTAAHYLGERCLEDLLLGVWMIDAKEYHGETIWVDPEGDGVVGSWDRQPELLEPPEESWSAWSVDDDMIWSVNVLINYVRALLESLGASATQGIPDTISVEIEAYSNLSHLGRDDMGGRIDVRITELLGELHVIDYKHGRGIPVSPRQNEQLMIYALGGDVNADMIPSGVTLTIVQPRCPKNEPVESWSVPGGSESLRIWARETLLPAAEATTDPEAPLIPGEIQCLWCAARPHCAKAHDLALTFAASEFDDLPAEYTPGDELAAADPAEARRHVLEDMDLERVLRILDMRDFLEGAVKAAVVRVTAELNAGRPVPGWKLVEGQSKRRWKPGADEILRKKKVPASIVYDKKPASFTVVEKARDGKWAKLVEQLVEKPAGAATLVRETDNRPALAPAIETDFDDEPDPLLT